MSKSKKYRSKIVHFVTLIAFILAAISLPGNVVFANNTTYYVSTSGSDSNNGISTSTPWKTLAKVSSITFNPGDKILLKCGDTWNNETLTLHGSGTSTNVIELGSYGTGEKPTIINNSNTDVIYGTNLSFWLINNLKIGCTSTTRIDSTQFDSEETAIYLKYDGTGPYYGMQIRGNEFYGTGVDYKTSGIVIQAEYPSTKNNLVLQGIYITNNYMHDMGVRAIHTAGWTGTGSILSSEIFKDVYVEANRVYNIGCQGIIIGMANNAFIRWNNVSYGGQSLYNLGWGPAGIWPMEVNTAEVKFNEVSYQGTNGSLPDGTRYDGEGIDLDWDTQNIIAQYNYVHHNDGAGMGTMANSNNKIYNNKITHNLGLTTVGAAQVAISDFTAGSMYGVNNLDMQNNLIICNEDNTKALYLNNVTPGGTWNNNNFSNNNIVMGDSTGNLVYGILNNTNFSTINNNKIYSAGGNWFGAWRYGNYYWELASWRAATGYDMNSSMHYSESVAPTNPSNASAIGNGNNTVALSWSASSDSGSGVSHYNIYRSTVSGFTPAYSNMVGEATGTTFVDDIYITPGKTFYYKIEAEDNNGNVSSAIECSVTTDSNILKNSGFEKDGQNTQNPAGWSTWTDNNSQDADYTNNYQPYSGGYRLEHYKASSGYRVFTYQTPTGLVNGLYTVKAWVVSSGGQNTCQMQVKDFGGTGIYTNITAVSWTQITVTNVNVTNGQCTIGFWSDANAGNWLVVDNVELIKQ